MKQAISSPFAPTPVGPYSAALRSTNLLFVSGQVPIDPATGELVRGDIQAQTERVIRNIEAILQAASVSLRHVVRTTVYLADMDDFAQMNEAYGRFFTAPAPARATVQVSRLPKDARIEIDAIALAG